MPPPLLHHLFRKTPSLVHLPHRGVLSVAGPHAVEFLHGLLATPLPSHGPLFSAFLHAQGRVLYDVFIYTSPSPAGQRVFLLEYDSTPSEALPLLHYLKRHVLRSKVKIRDVTEENSVWASWGSAQDHVSESDRSWNWSRSGAVEPAWIPGNNPWGKEDGTILDRRAPGMGRRFLVRNGERPQQVASHDVASTEDYTLHRILHGVPEGRIDIPAMHAFPMESNLDIMGGLDFRKGCYVGQELTVRTYHTGVVRKRIFPIMIHKPSEQFEYNSTPNFAPDIDIRPAGIQSKGAQTSPKPRGSGKLLSSSGSIALALLRLEHIAAVQKGDIKLALEIPTKNENEVATWDVTPWRPSWWPHRPLQD